MKTLKEKVKACERICGTHIAMTEPALCELLGYLGYDFIWIDTEHAYLDCKDVLIHANAARAAGTPVIVRVPQNDLTYTKKILEMGPDGIIFPMVHSAEEAKELLSYTLYPPYGKRGFGPQRAIRYGIDNVNNYIGEGHLDMCRFVQIEHFEAVDDIENIAKIPYLDGIIFGPFDLSGSINKLGDVFGEENTKLIKRTVEVVKQYGKTIGVSMGPSDVDTLKHWRDLGINMISSGSDFTYILEGATKTLENLRKVQGID